ncbi:MAG TPA: CocE/NonD family hydrolase [Actinomycetota bacterium]|nr:CocE/NonD family hydrolase [Actinomycetota bacterium]
MAGVIVEKNVEAKLRDGTVLRGDVYRPAEDGPHPVLLMRTPYNKDVLALTILHLDPIKAASNGFIVAVQDVRGRWASDGDTFFLYRNEFDDGYDSVDWAANLPGCSGAVGAFGVSYMGGTAWHAAATAPPALKAISTCTSPNDFIVNHVRRGGAFLLGTFVQWSLLSIGPNAMMRAKAGSPDFLPSLVQLIDDIDGFEDRVRHMPLTEFPPARVDDDTFLPFFKEILARDVPDELTRSMSVSDKHDRIEVPALIMAGWYDLLLASDLEHYASMKTEAATEEARAKTKLVIAPWSHGMFLNVVGELDFGIRSSGLLMDLKEDLTAMQLRWFSQRLSGIDTGIDDEPRVKIFVQGINRWRDEDDWPLSRAVDTPWFLGAGDALSPAAPGPDEEHDSYVYDPSDPCPTLGGNLLMPRTYVPGPVEQSPILGRSDVLTYTSEPFSADLEFTGHVKAVLYAATDAPDTDWVVKLCVVYEDGRTFNVVDGIMRGSYRNGPERTLVDPGAVERYDIDLWATSIVIRAGQRLRVVVTSSDFPRYDRNPNNGELGVEATATVPARQRIFHDAERASHVLLPVIP